MKSKEIKEKVDNTVEDYVNRKISIIDLSSRLLPLSTGEVYEQLKEDGLEDLVGVLDQLADADFYITQETFNHHDPSNILKVIDDYYAKITT